MSTHSCEWLGCDLANNIHASDDFVPLWQEIAERREMVDLLTRLRAAGLVMNGSRIKPLTVAQLRAIVAILEDGAA